MGSQHSGGHLVPTSLVGVHPFGEMPTLLFLKDSHLVKGSKKMRFLSLPLTFKI